MNRTIRTDIWTKRILIRMALGLTAGERRTKIYD